MASSILCQLSPSIDCGLLAIIIPFDLNNSAPPNLNVIMTYFKSPTIYVYLKLGLTTDFGFLAITIFFDLENSAQPNLAAAPPPPEGTN